MGSSNILVVDDFEEDQQALIALIRDAGGEYSFETAKTGAAALTAFARRKHDCVFIDYRLGTENGLDVLSRLTEIDPFCAVIMMSGHGSEEVVADAMKSGAVDYLVKGNTSGLSICQAIKRTIDRRREQRKASLKQQEQNQFLSTLVHDIRAPFTNISNSAAMLAEDIESGQFEEIDSLLEAQSNAVKHATDLIKTLQIYALLDDEADFKPVCLGPVFEKLRQMFLLGDAGKQAVFEIDRFPDIRGHRPQIMQLFQNLISNALKYNGSERPRIRVRLAAADDRWVTICIEDNGLGIDEKYLGTIFQPLKRLWNKDEYEGTGLGLSICKKIVDRHQGRIWCESIVGQGSKFFVQLQSVA